MSLAEPVIVTASRATDVPAFYMEWFMNRLRAGRAVWVNPFNAKAMEVSLRRVRVFVFCSKNPAPLLEHLNEIEARNHGYYVQFTLNDYELEKIEPKVPPLEQRLETFRSFSRRIGPERVVWRFDPLLITPSTPPDELLRRVVALGEQLRGLTRKLVISFADIESYAKVGRCLRQHGIEAREFTPDEMRETAARIARHARGWGMEVGACAEAEDLTRQGVVRNKCVDDDLMAKCFPGDRVLMDYLGRNGPKQGELFSASAAPRRDKGQRKHCGCVRSKDIGAYSTCPHLCRYCYANSSASRVLLNHSRHDPNADSLSSGQAGVC